MSYALDARTQLLVGYNYGRNPVPAEHTQPLLAATAEHHVTFGVVRLGEGDWRETFAVEYQPGNTVRYVNPELPFAASEERNRNVALHFMLSRRW